MSYFIELSRIIIKIPKNIFSEHRFSKDEYFLALQLGGSNNLIDNETGKFSREWGVIGFGSEEDIISRIIDLSKSAHTGEIKPNGKRTKAETYISKWRKAFKTCYSFSDYIELFPSIIIAAIPLDETSNYQRKSLIKNHPSLSVKEECIGYSNIVGQVYTLDLTSLSDRDALIAFKDMEFRYGFSGIVSDNYNHILNTLSSFSTMPAIAA